MDIIKKIERDVMSSIDIKKAIKETKKCFNEVIEKKYNYEERECLSNFLLDYSFFSKFSGLTIHIFEKGSPPFLRVRLDIFNKENNKFIAWYEVEYGIDGQILDDFFYHI